MTSLPPPTPGDPVTDDDRAVVVARIQRAVANDQLDFDQLDERFESTYAAVTRAQLEASVADLPTVAAPVPVIGHPAPSSTVSLLGDVKLGGWIEVDGDLAVYSAVGDVTIDLSSARLKNDVTIRIFSLMGDTTVIVPDGVRANQSTVGLLGSRRVDLSPARAGMPTVRVVTVSALGDNRLFSLSLLPEGRLRKLWRQFRTPGS